MKGGDTMATTPTQIRIDADIKQQAVALFNQLGLDMSGAVNLFLHQCVLCGGLPFAVEMPQYSQATLDAMSEARRISHDPHSKGYDTMEALKAALEED
jgi:DNA-damage-inducible protein J